MKNKILMQGLVLAACISLFSSCELVEGIFKAGVWSGVILIVLVIALIIFVISWIGGKKND